MRWLLEQMEHKLRWVAIVVLVVFLAFGRLLPDLFSPQQLAHL
jgi:hypothetical protein